jgi:hypothetical protein
MTDDPTKVEPWLISSTGYWREGILPHEGMILVECTSDQAAKIQQRWAEILHNHVQRRRSLEAFLKAELNTFKKHPLEQIL